ncbi:MAG: CAP domain-containing protein [Patescibacteria group bacterium]
MKVSRFKSVCYLSLAAGIMSLLFLFPGVSRADTLEPSSDIIYLTNRTRLQNGLNALVTNPALTLAAQDKAADMLNRDYFDHTSPDGRQPWDFIQAEDYQYTYAGENLALDFLDASTMFQGWMSSPTHRANILFPDYQEIGVATYSRVTNGTIKVVAVQMFGSRSDFLSVSPALIDQENTPNRSFTLIDGQRSDVTNAGYVSSAFTDSGQQLELARKNKNLAAFTICYGSYAAIVIGLIAYFSRRRLLTCLPHHTSAGDVLSHPGL